MALRRSPSQVRAKTVPNLTDLAIRTLPEGLHLDTRLTSFGIRVGKKRKTWVVIKGKNRTKVALGHYPAISLADARKRALLALAANETEQITTPVFSEALSEFLEKHLAHLRPVSAYQIKRVLTRHFSWAKPLDQISHRDIVEALDAIEASSERAHALKDIRTFFNWCTPAISKPRRASGSRSRRRNPATACSRMMNFARSGNAPRSSVTPTERSFSFSFLPDSAQARLPRFSGSGLARTRYRYPRA